MPQLMNFVDDPSCVDSLVKHLPSWKPFKSHAAVKDWDAVTAAAVETKPTILESEGRVDDEPTGDATTKSVGLEESTAVEATAVHEASMEPSSAEAEAPTTAEQENPDPVEVPMLTGHTRVEGNVLTPLDKHAFGLKRDFTMRKGVDIHGRNGSATKAKNEAVSRMTNGIPNPKLTSHQIVFTLREASVHPKAGLCFKSAGLIDCKEFDTLKRTISNCDKFLARALKSGVTKGRVSNEQSQMANALFVAFSDSPQDLDSDDEQRKVSPSKRKRLSLLPLIPTSTGQLKFKKMEVKESLDARDSKQGRVAHHHQQEWKGFESQ